MVVNLKTISKHTGVSVSTVSHILSGRAMRYSSKTKDTVFSAAKELGYSPNGTARALVTGRTNRIAFWSPTMGARFFQELAYRFHQILQGERYEMMDGEFGPQLMNPIGAMGISKKDVDGVLMYGGGLGPLREVLERNFPAKAPIVNMGVQCDGLLDFVNIDLYPAAVEALEYLVVSGCKRIAYVFMSHAINQSDARYRAYHNILLRTGIAPELIPVPDWTRPAVRKVVVDYIQTYGCPDAMFCMNDEFAMGALRGLRDVGKLVPYDIQLIGCDGIEDLEYLDAPISTIAQPMVEICELAWGFLKNRMENPNIPQQKVNFQARFIARK